MCTSLCDSDIACITNHVCAWLQIRFYSCSTLCLPKFRQCVSIGLSSNGHCPWHQRQVPKLDFREFNPLRSMFSSWNAGRPQNWEAQREQGPIAKRSKWCWQPAKGYRDVKAFWSWAVTVLGCLFKAADCFIHAVLLLLMAQAIAFWCNILQAALLLRLTARLFARVCFYMLCT